MNIYNVFDTLEWSFMIKAFEYFTLMEYVIKLISIIHNNIDNQIINNGQMSKGFIVTREVRQGNPLSPCIFVTAIELSVVAVRHTVNQGYHTKLCRKNQSICR